MEGPDLRCPHLRLALDSPQNGSLSRYYPETVIISQMRHAQLAAEKQRFKISCGCGSLLFPCLDESAGTLPAPGGGTTARLGVHLGSSVSLNLSDEVGQASLLNR